MNSKSWTHRFRYLSIGFLLMFAPICSLATVLGYAPSCNSLTDEYRERFEGEIGYVVGLISKSDTPLERQVDTPLVLDCSMTGLVAYSTKVNGRGTVVIGLGLLDIAERLSWASALALYGAPEIFDSYPKYLAEQIIIRKRNPANIKQPIDMVPSSVAKEARDNKTIKRFGWDYILE